jgi:hypothetical protein
MSTHYGYVCQQDSERITELFTNPRTLQRLVRAWPIVREVVAHPEYGQEFAIDFTYMGGRSAEVVCFFREHYDHDIAVESEYGEVEPVKEYTR